MKGEYKLSLEYLKQGLKLSNEIGHKRAIGKFHNNIGMTYWQIGDLNQALDHYHKSIEIYQKVGNKQLIAILLLNIGLIFWHRGDLSLALEYNRSSLNVFEQLGEKKWMADALNNMGLIHLNKGNVDIALNHLQRSLSIREDIGSRRDIGTSFLNIGYVYENKGNLKKAFSFHLKSLELFEKIGNNLDLSESLMNLVSVSVYMGLKEKAGSYLEKLRSIKNNENNKLIDVYYRISKAKLLKMSNRFVKRAEAQLLLQQIADEDVLVFELTIDAMVNLSELLLMELKDSGDEEVLMEVKELLNRLLNLSKSQNSHSWLANTYLLQSKLSLLELDMESAQQLLVQAQLIAEEKELHQLKLTITQENDLLMGQIEKWEKFIEQKPALSEIIEISQFNDLIERLVHKRMFRDEEEIDQYAKEAKVLYDRWEKVESEVS